MFFIISAAPQTEVDSATACGVKHSLKYFNDYSSMLLRENETIKIIEPNLTSWKGIDA